MSRQSNFELLRILAMLFVLILHATYSVFDYPKGHLVQAAPFSWLGIILTAQATVCAVNTFVLITGWFGTHLKWTNLLRLIFQVLFYCVLITLGVYLLKGERHSLKEFAQSLTSYWFVSSYLLLYLLSPILNAFIAQSDERTLRRYLIGWYIVTIPLSLVGTELAEGYSALSFVGLYLLGRYLRLYGASRLANLPHKRFLQLFLINTLGLGGMAWVYFCVKPAHFPNPTLILMSYTSPFVILNAVCLILYFSRLHLQSKVINWLAAGSFAAYLTHQQLFVRSDYFEAIRTLSLSLSTPIFILATAGVILTIFLLSASIDHCREWIWIKVLHHVNGIKDR